ncbi:MULTISPECIES: ABC transporter ATP-binding protein [unclassified Bradyrhizobium]|uniref:ABC transporter ATP-binding protein n=1 Tax=unclassified Bradyrhizobium TaxID=2631580 RepID=UPI0024797CF4|nr:MULTISPECIES: ABC transporter ATP-binding protein [unclassified Bradyrhizobium]WGS19139.1 ABC transporter ATP-binding protein [Bradyrhizobium sp. ISRA463]WGS25977.1 ABC transporter ATP-binding protein [Bradyrhizobium sp. ISRA464]
MEQILEITGLRVAFDGVPMLRGIDLTLARGESLGMVGESGCGKSVTWLAALGLLTRRARITGSVRLAGEELLHAPASCLDRVRGGRIAMIFQDPASALNPVHTVGDQIIEALRLHRGMDRRTALAEARRLLDQVGIPDAARRVGAYPHELSGGQSQRAMIAMALAGQPDVLIADEPTTALDVTIQAQILDLLQHIQRETGMALVLISHDLGVVGQICERILVLYAGHIVEELPADRLFDQPIHPYTRGLLAALPSLEAPRHRLPAIPGVVPNAADFPPGCPFAPRCDLRIERCGAWVTELASLRGDARHRAACLHVTGEPPGGEVVAA